MIVSTLLPTAISCYPQPALPGEDEPFIVTG
jgi:hypothetical protein